MTQTTIAADGSQAEKLVDWANELDGGSRLWAVEAAGGLGYLLSQQLIACGDRVVDVPPVLASRVRVLLSGHSEKNDPNGARAVAIVALRQPNLALVHREDYSQVLRMGYESRDFARSTSKGPPTASVCSIDWFVWPVVPAALWVPTG